MSLTDIVALPAEERKPNIKVDLSSFLGEDKFVEFREPRLGDLYPDSTLVERLRISFPLTSAEQLGAAVLLGKCYVKKPEEQSMDAIRTMCQILENNPKIYLRMARQFNEEFMSVYNEIVASEGNVLAE